MFYNYFPFTKFIFKFLTLFHFAEAVLESILSSESCKIGLPSLQELLQNPFFNVADQNHFTKIDFKISSSLRQSMKAAIKSTEKRLQNEQRAIRYQKKVIKMQELLSSENDLTRRKKLVSFYYYICMTSTDFNKFIIHKIILTILCRRKLRILSQSN